MPRPLVRPRTHAFANQSGRGYYCGALMWADDRRHFDDRHRITLGQAKSLQCTGEHLVARQGGGSSGRSNSLLPACYAIGAAIAARTRYLLIATCSWFGSG